MRQSGYYWVRLNEHRDWEIALWGSEYNYWSFPGFTSAIRQVFEIDERRILPPMENIEHQPGNKSQCDDNT